MKVRVDIRQGQNDVDILVFDLSRMERHSEKNGAHYCTVG